MGDPVCLYTNYPHSLCTQLKVSLLYPLITSLYIRYTLFYIEGSMLLKLLIYTIVVKWCRKLSIIGPKNCPPPNGKNSILLYDLTILSLGRVNFSKTLLFQSIFVKNWPLSYKKQLWCSQVEMFRESTQQAGHPSRYSCSVQLYRATIAPRLAGAVCLITVNPNFPASCIASYKIMVTFSQKFSETKVS